MPKNTKGSDDEFQFKRRNQDFALDPQNKSKKDAKADFYQCGDPNCNKCYHSYTAFYNHCKKTHGGEFPEKSLHNGKNFQGPSKNRGRPRIRKNQTKDQGQIESMKRQNELIQFLGTLKTKKMEQLIVHVENPIERLQKAVDIVLECLQKEDSVTEEKQHYLEGLKMFNRIVTQNDLPQFYDPIQSDKYKDNLDSYSFSSIFNFMNSKDKRAKFEIQYDGNSLLYKILIVWLSRILSQKLLAEVVYTLMVFQIGGEMIERELLVGRIDRFKEICSKYFQSFLQDEKEIKEEN